MRRWVALRLVGAGVVAALLLATPAVVHAHEKWFTDARPYPVRLELLISLPVALAVLASAGAVGLLLLARRVVGGDNLFPRVGFLRRFDPEARVVMAIQTAITLIYLAVNLRVLAPNQIAPAGPLGYGLAAVELVVAFSFISGVLLRAGAVALLALVASVGVLYGPFALLESSIMVGVAAYLFLMGRGLVDPQAAAAASPRWAEYREAAPPLLRVLAGVTIAALAFTEKLLNPGLGLAFLRHYPQFNVPRLLGLAWFTDERYIYAAGSVELIIGVALISGVLPRLVIIGMFVPFNLPVPFLPATEMIGHLPIFALMYVLLFHLPSAHSAAEAPTHLPPPRPSGPRLGVPAPSVVPNPSRRVLRPRAPHSPRG